MQTVRQKGITVSIITTVAIKSTIYLIPHYVLRLTLKRSYKLPIIRNPFG